MPRYTFFLLTENTHPNWRGAGEGAMQQRVIFKRRTASLLNEEELRELIIQRIRDDKTGRCVLGIWTVVEHTTNKRYRFKIDDDDIWEDWFG